jgi:GDP-4-dehydro-6-deoxy-D-mannose reductase
MRFLITGITGFAARALAEHLLAEGHEVCGTTRTPPTGDGRTPPAISGIVGAERLHVVGLDDPARLTALLREVRPDGVFHLAAFTSPSASFADPAAAYRANLGGSLNLFSAVCDAGHPCRVVWVGSSDVYGYVREDEIPVTEASVFRPLSPYAVSKAAADLAAYQWSRSHALDVVRMRPFNHTGPGQDPQFVCADFALQLAAVERGLRPARIEVGNLDVTRDFSDVRDVVRAYALAWRRGEAGEAYNVCSGIGRTTREILEGLIRLSAAQVTVTPVPERQRRVDAPLLVGSADKLRRTTGWAPAITWEQTLRDVLEDWRQRFTAGA